MNRKAFTLLEVVLALSLAMVILGLLGMAVHVHLRVADVTRAQVEEARVANSVLHRIAEDLRNVLPYTPPASSEDTATGTTASTSSGANDGPWAGGLRGTEYEVQFDVGRPPRPKRGADTSATGDRPSDAATVSYYLLEPTSDLELEEAGGSPGARRFGLFRRESDRAATLWAAQQGQSGALDGEGESLAPEVAGLRFSYMDDTNAEPWTEWDSQNKGGLPAAVQISIVIRGTRPAAARSAGDPPVGNARTYSLLVALPKIQATSQSSSQGARDAAGGPQEGQPVESKEAGR